MTRLRWRKPYSNTGLGQQPTPAELHGLFANARQRHKRCKAMWDGLMEKAKKGDQKALRALKHIQAARFQNSRKQPTPTKVKFSWDEEKVK